MNNIEIHKWGKINYCLDEGYYNKRVSPNLVLGNGASIALHSDFNYVSLYDKCIEKELFSSDIIQVFKELDTCDFEEVMLAYQHAILVNKASGKEYNKIERSYNNIRQSLIEVIQEIHPIEMDKEELWRIGSFLTRFDWVFSLNYDLTLYWSMMEVNKRRRYEICDSFLDGKFNQNSFSCNTNVFYPHGSLLLSRNIYGDEQKIKANQDLGNNKTPLLDTIFKSWKDTNLPLFISEGSSKKKLQAIRRSPYLSTVYRYLSLGDQKNIVIYGMSFSDNDEHILKGLLKSKICKIAISVYTGIPSSEQQAFCHKVISKIQKYAGNRNIVPYLTLLNH